ncbi:MAG: toast rack family protein [Anaerolineales bacterium]
MSRHNVFWGVILILIGAIFLADTFGGLTLGIRLIWPLLIVALGVYILMGSSWASKDLETQEVSVPLDGAKQASIRLEHGAGRVRISGAASKGALLSGSFEAMRMETRKSGSKLDVRLRTAVEDAAFWVFPWNWHRGRRGWDFSLNPDVPIALKIETGASENRLDLSELTIERLDIDTGASSTTVVMPKKAGHTDAEISGGAASFDITIPKGVAARIEVQSGLGSVNVDEGRFPRAGKAYQSENYKSAANTLDLRIEVGVSSVSIR